MPPDPSLERVLSRRAFLGGGARARAGGLASAASPRRARGAGGRRREPEDVLPARARQRPLRVDRRRSGSRSSLSHGDQQRASST